MLIIIINSHSRYSTVTPQPSPSLSEELDGFRFLSDKLSPQYNAVMIAANCEEISHIYLFIL